MFIKDLSKRVLLKVRTEGSERRFLGRRMKHNGDSIDVSISPPYIGNLLDLDGTQEAKCVQIAGSVTVSRTVSEEPLSKEAHNLYRTAVGKLPWLALNRGDIPCATIRN